MEHQREAEWWVWGREMLLQAFGEQTSLASERDV